ncbi:hypothetical protein AB0J52_32780, partial [Spirillospora sp. NPDC049652]
MINIVGRRRAAAAVVAGLGGAGVLAAGIWLGTGSDGPSRAATVSANEAARTAAPAPRPASTTWHCPTAAPKPGKPGPSRPGQPKPVPPKATPSWPGNHPPKTSLPRPKPRPSTATPTARPMPPTARPSLPPTARPSLPPTARPSRPGHAKTPGPPPVYCGRPAPAPVPPKT